MLGDCQTYVRDGAVAIVAEALDETCHSTGTHGSKHHLFHAITLKLPCPFFDGTFNIGIRHAVCLRRFNRRTQCSVTQWIGTALCRDLDETRMLGVDLAAFGILGSFAHANICPFTVTRHGKTIHECLHLFIDVLASYFLILWMIKSLSTDLLRYFFYLLFHAFTHSRLFLTFRNTLATFGWQFSAASWRNGFYRHSKGGITPAL